MEVSNLIQSKFVSYSKDWTLKRLSDLIDETRLGGNYKNSQVYTGLPLIKMGNIGRGKINLSKIEYVHENESIEDFHILRKGDLLFNTRNTLDLVGKVAIWNSELQRAAYNSNLLKISFDSKAVYSNEFANYVFNSEYVIRQLRAIATGTTSVAAIYFRDLVTVKFALPPLAEQRKIADILTTVDEQIATTQAIIDETRELKRGLMQALFTKGIGHTKFKDTKIGVVPEDWEVVKLGDICIKSKTKFEPRNSTEVLPYIGLEHIEANTHRLIGNGNSNETTSTKNKFLKGEILYGKLRPYLNKVILAPFDGVSSTEIFVINPTRKITKQYLYQIFQRKHFVDFANSRTEGTSLPRFGWNDMKNYPVAVPSIKEQEKISTLISKLTTKLNEEQQTKQDLETLKRGLMQVLLTGKVRVKV